MSVASTAASRSASSSTTSGPLPPISSSSSLPAARSATRWPVAIEPMNPTVATPGVRGHLVADHGAGAGDEVEGTGRQVGLGDHLGERHRAHAGRGRRREDDRVPAREGGRNDLAGHRVRPVPRADDARHAARDPVDEHAVALGHRRRDEALDPHGVGRRHLEVRDQLLDLVERLRPQRLALVQRQRARHLVPSTIDRLGDAPHRPRAVEGGEPRPRTERVPAASTARRTSPRVPSGSVPMTSPVEGEVASNVAPLSEPTHSPAMNIR